MTSHACYVVIAVRKLTIVRGNCTPGRVIFSDRLRIARFLTVVTTTFGNGIGRLDHAPPTTGHYHRVLNDVAYFQIDIISLLVFSFSITRDSLEQRDTRTRLIAHTDASQILSNQWLLLCLSTFGGSARGGSGSWPGREQSGFFADTSMTVNARHFDCSSRFVVKISVTVRVLPEMAIDTLHASLSMNVVEVYRFAEPSGIVSRNDFVFGVAQISFAIALDEMSLGGPADHRADIYDLGIHHIGLWVDNIQEIVQRAREGGHPVVMPHTSSPDGYGDDDAEGRIASVFLRDPEGNLIQCDQRIREDEFTDWHSGSASKYVED